MSAVGVDSVLSDSVARRPVGHSRLGVFGPGFEDCRPAGSTYCTVDERVGVTEALLANFSNLYLGLISRVLAESFTELRIRVARGGSETLQELREHRFNFTLIGISFPDAALLDGIATILESSSTGPLMLVTGRRAPRALRALKAAACISIFDSLEDSWEAMRLAITRLANNPKFRS